LRDAILEAYVTIGRFNVLIDSLPNQSVKDVVYGQVSHEMMQSIGDVSPVLTSARDKLLAFLGQENSTPVD
jgi:hypothetical protein